MFSHLKTTYFRALTHTQPRKLQVYFAVSLVSAFSVRD